MVRVLLISTYELGRQPFGLASPAAWLRADGAEVTCLDLSQQELDPAAVRAANLIAFYLPMHTATRIAAAVVPRVRAINPDAQLCAFGLYAPLNASWLRESGVSATYGGEFEAALAHAVRTMAKGGRLPSQSEPETSFDRLQFKIPDRQGLPSLDRYAALLLPGGTRRVTGYTEATRGCKHLCRHCPIVPIYGGRFRAVQRNVVMADIRQQVAAGAQHITFGDPDFFNGVTHAREIVRALHREFPTVSYDVTIKVEHLLRHADALPVLRDTGCAFVTSAVESVDDHVLAILDKGHTRADFVRAVKLMREIGLPLAPTFVAFTPWTTADGYLELLDTIADFDLAESVAPVQLSIRLLIPAGSRLLEVEDVRRMIGVFDAAALCYPWFHPDPRMDELQRTLERRIQMLIDGGFARKAIIEHVRSVARHALSGSDEPRMPVAALPARATIPYLTEPWYC